MTAPSAEAAKLRQILNKLQSDMDAVKAGASAPQLDNSSIEVTQGRGFIPIMENGVVKHIIGRQPDGTITSVSKNNTSPPVVPNTPSCAPFIGGVTVTCDGFGTQQFLDFSHINVYVDGNIYGTLMKVPEAYAVAPLTNEPHGFQLTSVNLSGTESPKTNIVLATPNMVISQDIQDGMITTLKLANDAVTEAKIAAQAVTGTEIADDSISTPKVIAGAITTALIATGAVTADSIAANSITSSKILANAITAVQIAANAVTAGQIAAGSIDATKLAAQVILASTAIIAGNPTGKRVVIDPTGITQTDAMGNIALLIGASVAGNAFTVIDPANPTNALANVGADGSMTMSGISINGTANLNGVDLVGYLNASPRGIVAVGNTTTNSASTTSTVGMFEVQFDAVAGRFYHIYSSPLFINGDEAQIVLLATTDGTVPKITSALVGSTISTFNTYMGGHVTSVISDGHNHFEENTRIPGVISEIMAFSSSVRTRLLLAVKAIGAGAVSVNADFNLTGITLTVEDIGTMGAGGYTGGTNAGGGTTSANGQYISTYIPTYTKYAPDTTNTLVNGLQEGMAGTVNYMSMIGLPYAQMITDLTGATILKVELFLYSSYWALSTGGLAAIGTHNDSSAAPTNYSFVARDTVDQPMKKPQGGWVPIPISFITNLKAGTVKGFVLDSRVSAPGTSNYGMFRDLTYTDPTMRPQLRITYTK